MEIIETPIFTKLIIDLISDDSYSFLQKDLAENPEKGTHKMKEDDFKLLIESIKQAGEIRAGRLKPSREFTIETQDVKNVRKALHVTQSFSGQALLYLNMRLLSASYFVRSAGNCPGKFNFIIDP
jgi:hypothetical protein